MTTVAALYYELVDDPEENRERLLAGMEEALARADVVVGPETATIGIGLDPGEVQASAETLDGETVTLAREVVDGAGGVVVFGLPERSEEDVYNACVVLEAGRDPEVYRQREYPYTHAWTTAYGDDRLVEVGVGSLAPAVCAELSFPEKREYLASSGADLVVAPACWGEADVGPPLLERWIAWSAQIDAPLAIGNVYSPAWRSDQDFSFDGPAAILDDGSVLSHTNDPGNVIFATL